MNSILVAKSGEPGLYPERLREMYRFRHQVFKEKLDWEVGSFDGMEIDAYDGLNPFYMLSLGRQQQVEGCWRILPTLGPYMLKNTFPQLLRGETIPQAPDIWELSRFAVDSPDSGDLAQGCLSQACFDMVRELYDFARRQGIRQYVTVTSVAVERMFRRAGFPIRRFGDGKATRIGRVLTVACWVDVNEQYRRVVHGKALPQVAEEAA